MKLVYGIIIFIITFSILLINDENKKSKEKDVLPDGYATDFLLKTNDLKNGVSKSEIKRRERSGYYLKPCDKHHLIDNKTMGKPY